MASTLRDVGLPQSGERGSFLDSLPTGRTERRFPIIVVVRLARANDQLTEEPERTYTDNVSGHGLRLISRRVWQAGEEAEVTPVNEESPVRGKVVYCQNFEDGRYVLGVKFEGKRLPWHILERFDGF